MLSKTRFQYAMICRKRAWLDAHRRELGRPPDAALRLRLADGHRVGRIARELWAGGVLVTEPSARHARAAARTSLLLEDASVSAIFEGAFAHDGLRIRADVIARNGSSFELVEVKSASRPRDDHVLDLAIQAYVIDGSGVELASASLLHVNREYVWQGGPLDPSSLFVRVDLTEEVFRLLPEVRDREREFRSMLAASEPPAVAMGPQCHKHDVCPFFSACRRESGLPSPDAPDLSGLAAAITLPSPATDAPVTLLDVQSFSTALPRIAGSSPHERIPFLWSLRIVAADGSIADHQGLPLLDGDPRPAFADSLAARLPATGPVVYFSKVVPTALEALAERGLEAARVCTHRLDSGGIDLRTRIEDALGPPSDESAWSWETLAGAAVPLSSSVPFASRREAAAACVTAIDRATSRSRRETIAEALARYGRANLAALAILAGVARVGPRV
jgi:CRISPR/Cas system-associated exonuclease Cas4 (RecB family)